ncbi:MAG: hypothetical protein U9N53_08895 [Bacteroidota bacterium]|nr:hypothetical protein [Bacteroidota bacterium]
MILQDIKRNYFFKELGIAPTNLWQIIHKAKVQLRDCIEAA